MGELNYQPENDDPEQAAALDRRLRQMFELLQAAPTPPALLDVVDALETDTQRSVSGPD